MKNLLKQIGKHRKGIAIAAAIGLTCVGIYVLEKAKERRLYENQVTCVARDINQNEKIDFEDMQQILATINIPLSERARYNSLHDLSIKEMSSFLALREIEKYKENSSR